MKEPMSCTDCKTNFCLRCFQNKLIKDNKCVECQTPNPKLKNLQKCLLDVLERAEVQCKYCSTIQRYNDIVDHEVRCKRERGKTPR